MAAPYHPELFSVEEVMGFFETQKGSCWTIYAGSNPRADDWSRGECTISDKQLAAERLNENLHALKQNTDNVNPYTIRVYNLVKGQQKDKSSIIFQLNKRDRIMYPAAVNGMGTDPQMIRLMEKMIESQNVITSKLAAMEMEEEEEQEPEKVGILGKLLEKPEVQDFLMQGAMALVAGFAKGKPQTYGGGVAGTVDQESVTLLQSLFNKGVTNDTLKALDQMSAAKLQSLLTML